jgi:hypothetical protein
MATVNNKVQVEKPGVGDVAGVEQLRSRRVRVKPRASPRALGRPSSMVPSRRAAIEFIHTLFIRRSAAANHSCGFTQGSQTRPGLSSARCSAAARPLWANQRWSCRPSIPKPLPVFARTQESLDHFGLKIIAVEAVEFGQPEGEARHVGVATQIAKVFHQHKH